MKSFHATLNLTFEAIDEQQALEIARHCKELIVNLPGHVRQPWKVEVDIDDVEEN